MKISAKCYITVLISLVMLAMMSIVSLAGETADEQQVVPENQRHVMTLVGEVSPTGVNETVYYIDTAGVARSADTIYGAGNSSSGSGTATCTLITNFRYNNGNTGSCTLKIGSNGKSYNINCDGVSRVISRDVKVSKGMYLPWEISNHQAGLVYVIKLYTP